jgi:predicted PurR-regulated permease PerM
MTASPRPTREQAIGAGLRWTSGWCLRWLLIAATAVALGYVVQYAWSILLPVLLALIVTTVLEGPVRLLERYLRFPPALASAVVLLGSIAVLVAIAFAIAPSVSGQSGDIVKSASAGLQKLQDWVQESDFISRNQVDAALQEAQDRIQSSGGAIASGFLTTVGAVSSAVITLVITLVLTFFFLKDGRRFVPWARGIAGPRAGVHVGEVLHRSWRTLGGFIRTQALVSAIDAVFIGLGLVLVGVPLAIPLAILTFFGGFVPIVGAVVVGALAVLVALVSNGVTGALIILAVILAVQQLEGNVLSPWLQSKSMQLHAAVVLLSVTLGSTLFGITGAFLAVPTVAVAAVVLRYLNDQVTAVSGEPSKRERSRAEKESDSDADADSDAGSDAGGSDEKVSEG